MQLRPFDAVVTGCDEPGKPELAARLEAQLAARLQALRSLQAGSGGGYGAAAMALDAHRQVFEAFLQGMTTYRPLLLRVKAAFGPALRDAMASVYDNVHLRGELARAPAELAAAVEEAHNTAERDAAAMARELEDKLAQAEAQADEAEREARNAEDQLSRFQKSTTSAKRELEQLTAANRRAQQELLAASSWARLGRPGAGSAGAGGTAGGLARLADEDGGLGGHNSGDWHESADLDPHG